MQMYFGDVSLCYSYSLAMALETYGYDFKAEFLEAIMVMGNGASIVKEDEEHPLVFFDNGMPDLSISHSLKILGFDYEDFYLKDGAEVDLEEIKGKLETFLSNGPVVLGPINMEQQLLIAIVIMGTSKIFLYFPILLFSGMITGIIIGILAYYIKKTVVTELGRGV